MRGPAARRDPERPKQGFGVPLGDWFRGELRPMVEDTLLDRPRLAGRLRLTAVRALCDEHLVGPRRPRAPALDAADARALAAQARVRMTGALAAAAEALFLAALVAGALAAGRRPGPGALRALRPSCSARPRSGGPRGTDDARPAVALAARSACRCSAVLQALPGRSAGWVWTLEARAACWRRCCGARSFWGDRGRDRARPTRGWPSRVLAVCARPRRPSAPCSGRSIPTASTAAQSPFVTAPFGSYVNHNHFAGLVEMGGGGWRWALAVGRRAPGRRAAPRSLALGGLALGLAAAHLASRSRGGLLALGAGLAGAGAR